MASTTIGSNTTRNTTVTMAGNDDLTLVDATSILSVAIDAGGLAVSFASANGALITNNGTIENTDAEERAIRFTNGVGATLNATITNGGTGVIQSDGDAIQIQGSLVTSGTLTLNNNGGTIQSTIGQALDLAGGTGTFTVALNNSGDIFAIVEDAIRFGGVGNLINSGNGDIDGGTGGTYSGADGVQYEDNAIGTVNNNTSASIAGDRHAINAGLNTTITVTNGAGSFLTGHNGSGVGSDGTATVTNFGTITGAFNVNATDINGPGGPGLDGFADGDGDGIDIDFQATIINHGLIQGTGAGGHGSDGRANTSEGIAAGGGSITNHAGASITGLGLGILIDDSSTGNAPFLTSIVNYGAISGGSSYGIRIISNHADTIFNNGTITGGGGTAILFGTGNNALRLGAASSITGLSDGGLGVNTLNYTTFGVAGTTVNLATGAATGTGGVVRFQNVIGSAGLDRLTGNGLANSLTGNAGNDIIVGNSGDDILSGGDGRDSLAGGSGLDTLSGGLGIDTLTGGAGNDKLNGGSGNDFLIGSAGKDILTGSLGADHFVYKATSDSSGVNIDRVMDFDDAGNDKIDLSALSGVVLTYRGLGAFTGANQVHIRDVAGPDLLVEVNLGGTLAPEMTIRLVNTTAVSMAAGDFIL